MTSTTMTHRHDHRLRRNWKYRSSDIVVAVVELICSSHSLVLLQVEDEQVEEEQISIN